jgi:peptide/nickel transport system permease protein
LTDLQSELAVLGEGPEAPAEALTTAALGLGAKPLSPRKLAWRRFRRHKVAMVAAVVLILLTFACTFAGLLTQFAPNQIIRIPQKSLVTGRITLVRADYLSPQSPYWFGTNEKARDLYTNVLYGGRISLAVGFSVAIISTMIGTIIGVLAGYYGKWLDNALMRITDLFLAIPFLIFAILLTELPSSQEWARTLFGPPHSVRSVISVITVLFWMPVARIVRGMVLSLKEKEFVEAARAAGASDLRIMFRHLVPNCTGQIIVNTTLAVAGAILTESALSFLGLGVDPVFTPTWGNLLSNAQAALGFAAWVMWFPALAVVITVLCVNFIGDGLRDALDPKQLSV